MVSQDSAISRADLDATATVVQHSKVMGIGAVFRIAVLATAMAAASVPSLSTAALGWATITVNSLADPGAPGICTLRSAIKAANTRTAANGCTAGKGNDTIQFSVKGTIKLAETLPEVTDSHLTINGPAAPGIAIDGGGKVQVMQVAVGARLNLNKLTIANGFIVDHVNGGTGGGGGLFNSGMLTITSSSFADNSAVDESGGAGGGIFNSGTLTVKNSIFSGNSSGTSSLGFGGFGGGIFNTGTLTVKNSTFSRNSTSGGDLEIQLDEGGGIYNTGTLTVRNSTFSGNSSTFGGGISNTVRGVEITNIINSTFSGNVGYFAGAISNAGPLTVIDSTFSENEAEDGSGIYNVDTLTVTNSTFSGNFATVDGDGVVDNLHGLNASFKSSILASSSSENCLGAITDAGYNISADTTCGFAKTGSANNGDGVNPLLSPAGLRKNGGRTKTIALQSSSPAIDAIPLADCTDQSTPPKRIATDQRGFPRPDAREQVCDIGAYEFHNF